MSARSAYPPAPGWAVLEALIERGDAAGVAAAMHDLDEPQRRALAGPFTTYSRPWLTDRDRPEQLSFHQWTAGREQRGAALAVAAASCLPADGVVRWLDRGPRWWSGWPPTFHDRDRLLTALRARSPSTLAGVARRLALRVRRRSERLHDLAVELVTVSGVEPPGTEGFVRAWVARVGPVAHSEGRTLVDGFRHDPLLAALAPRLFEVELAGNPVDFDEQSPLPEVLAELAADGTLDRAVLLDGCLGRLLRGGRPGELRGYHKVYRLLRPTTEELTTRARDLVGLLPGTASPTAGLVQDALRRLDAADRLPAELLLRASRTVLSRPEKKLVAAQLSWLDAVARRRPDQAGALLAAASTLFAQPATTDVHARAIALVRRHARRLDAERRGEVLRAASGLPADLRARLAAALGDSAATAATATGPPAAAVPAGRSALPPSASRELPAPIDSPAQLAEEVAAALAGEPDPVSLERLLAALVRLTHADDDALAAALQPLRSRLPYSFHHWIGRGRRLALPGHAGAVLAATHVRPVYLFAPAQEPRAALSGATASITPGQLLAFRLAELAAQLHDRTLPPLLLATPTLAGGQVDADALVDRLAAAEASGWQPGAYDLTQALLRLPRELDERALRRTRTLTSPAGRRLAHTLETGVTDPTATAQLVDCTPFHPADRWETTELPDRRWYVTMVPPPDTPCAPVLRSNLPDSKQTAVFQDASTAALWPSVLASHRDAAAAHLLPLIASSADMDGTGGTAVVPLLAACRGPAGPALPLVLAYGLAAKQLVDRAAAVDATLQLAAAGELPGAALGARLASLTTQGMVKLVRAVPSLADAARAGAHADVWAIVAAALPAILTAEPAPRGTPDLLALGVETAERNDAHGTIRELTTTAARGGSSRLVTEARRLHRLLADTG